MEWKSKFKSKVSKKIFISDQKKEKERSKKRASTIRSSVSHNSLLLDDSEDKSFKLLSTILPIEPTTPRESSITTPRKKSKTFTVSSRGPNTKNENNNTENSINSNSFINSPNEENSMEHIEFPNIQEILEDSPFAFEKLKRLEQQMEQMISSVRKIVKLSKQVQQTGAIYHQTSSQFAEALAEFRCYDDDPRSFPFYSSSQSPSNNFTNNSTTNNNNIYLSNNEKRSSKNNKEELNNNFVDEETIEKHAQFISAVKSIGETFVEINEYQGTLLKQLSSIFTVPMEEFVKKDFRELKDISKNRKLIKLKYDNAIAKYSHIKKNEIEKVAEGEAELLSCRKEFQQSSLFYLSKMKELKSITPIEFLERSTAYLFAEKAYFQHGNNLHTTIEPKLNQFFSQMAISRDIIRNQIDEFTAKITEISTGSAITESLIAKTTTTCETKGYLFTKKNNKWSRKFFQIRDGSLYSLIQNKETKKITERTIANLLLCTVRAARDVERRFCFEVVSPFNNLLFQAENEEILQYWMQVIQNAIANQLNNQISQKSQLGAKDNNFDSHFDLLVKLHQLYPENSFCCDCSSPQPEWVSINLGILVCIECSGIHRQLGTHISKVRSLTLDSLDKETQNLLFSLGNKIGKIIFEYSLPPSFIRPSPDSDRATRESWIRDKYVKKQYIKPPSSSAPFHLEIGLHKATKKNLINKIYEKINQGAQINWRNPKNNNLTALHIAIIENQTVTCEFLIQNGADVNVRDNDDWTPLHHAAYLNRIACSILLIKRSANLYLNDNQNRTAVMVAIEIQNAHAVTLLRLAMYAEKEHSGNGLDDESFAAALKSFTDEVSDSSKPPVIDHDNLSSDYDNDNDDDNPDDDFNFNNNNDNNNNNNNKKKKKDNKDIISNDVSEVNGEIKIEIKEGSCEHIESLKLEKNKNNDNNKSGDTEIKENNNNNNNNNNNKDNNNDENNIKNNAKDKDGNGMEKTEIEKSKKENSGEKNKKLRESKSKKEKRKSKFKENSS